MASPFSQTMASRRSDFFYTRAAAMTAAVILALLWGDWFFTSPIISYETSQKVRITDQERIRERFTDETSGGGVYTQSFRKRKVTADFAPEAAKRIKAGQPAYLYIKDSSGDRTFTVPAAVVFDAAHPENRKAGRVTLEAEVPENVPNPFEKGTGEKVSIEAGRLTPADMVFRASGLGTDMLPVSSAPRSTDK